MSAGRIRLGTRASRLALVQANVVAAALRAGGVTVELVEIVTAGDARTSDTPRGEGAFVDALEAALREGAIDAAVHSAKDMPIPDEDATDLVVAAYPERADPRDALVTREGDATLHRLPAGAIVGTDSPRRTGFVLAARPDLRVVPLHGNVDTRIVRLDAGNVDGLILAVAGLQRLGLGHRIDERLDPGVTPPAPGQGALAVQVRADDVATRRVVASIDVPAIRRAVEAERLVLAATGGGCGSSVGALATVDRDEFAMLAGWTSPDGGRTVVAREQGLLAEVSSRSRDLAARLVRFGGRGARPRVVVTRAAQQADELVDALALVGITGISVPAVEIEPAPPGGRLDVVARQLEGYDWVIVTSPNGARSIVQAAQRVGRPLHGPSWAAVGSATGVVLATAGLDVRHQPDVPTAAALVSTLPIRPRNRVLSVRGDLADASVSDALRARGATVDDVIAYRTVVAPDTSCLLLGRAIREPKRLDAIVFTSASTVAGFVALAQGVSWSELLSTPAICFGRGAATAARAAGFRVIHEAALGASPRMAAAIAGALDDRPVVVSR